MNLMIPLDEIRDEDRDQVGGKAFSLACLIRKKVDVPGGLCIGASVYESYVSKTGLKERILLELSRKDFQEMRWEEIWDASLRIRNLFLTTPLPEDLFTILGAEIEKRFEKKAVVVRSSAPGEDSAKASFAGLHESYVNIRGKDAVLEHIRLVWASLWSDGALLYRKELGLDVEKSTMAVVVQEIVAGERSGVVFGENPNDGSQSVIEAVYGLNAGLVDGTVEPDRWILDRFSGQVLTRTLSPHEKWVVPSAEGTRLEPLPPEFIDRPVLSDEEVRRVFHIVRRSEEHFGMPQDMEWTFRGDQLVVLQSRPITTVSGKTPEDKRPWYLSLRKSFASLKTLRERIEGELIPEMVRAADRLAQQDFGSLSDPVLAETIGERVGIQAHWLDVYWKEFIPFAHGMRLFGQMYNDALRPEDPYAFMDLLGGGRLVSLERNRLLEEMAALLREDPSLQKRLKVDASRGTAAFEQALDRFTGQFGDLSCGVQEGAGCVQGRESVVKFLLEMADHPPARKRMNRGDVDRLTSAFLSRFEGEQHTFASQVLDLARASYRLRDDDNLYLGRIEKEMLRAVEEGKRRLKKREEAGEGSSDSSGLIEALRRIDALPILRSSPEAPKSPFDIKTRQMVGQPAGPGIARGRARVIQNPSDLFDFKAGEILVCDALDPNMTFVVPVASGIVERRGGMLIHGAIIAREYGLPCVTGVPHVTALIHTGEVITVDGFLGIVIVG